MLPTFPQCSSSLEFPEIFGQNLIAIIDWVCGNSEIMHCGILINTPYFHLSTVYQQSHNLIFRKMKLHNVWVMRVMEHLLLCWMIKGNMVSSVIARVIRQTTSPVKQTSQTFSSNFIPLFFLWVCTRLLMCYAILPHDLFLCYVGQEYFQPILFTVQFCLFLACESSGSSLLHTYAIPNNMSE